MKKKKVIKKHFIISAGTHLKFYRSRLLVPIKSARKVPKHKNKKNKKKNSHHKPKMDGKIKRPESESRFFSGASHS